jgi:hypothetical protein
MVIEMVSSHGGKYALEYKSEGNKDHEMCMRTRLMRRPCGSALVIVLFATFIFFTISFAICSIVFLQARSVFESQMADLSFYVADAGIRFATPKVMFNFFMRDAAPAHEVMETELYMNDAEFKGKIVTEIYDPEPVIPPEGSFTYRNKIACIGKIIRKDDDIMVAQRCVYAELYLGVDAGVVRMKVKKYYEKNR